MTFTLSSGGWENLQCSLHGEMEKLPLFFHGEPITDRVRQGNVRANRLSPKPLMLRRRRRRGLSTSWTYVLARDDGQGRFRPLSARSTWYASASNRGVRAQPFIGMKRPLGFGMRSVAFFE